MPYTSNKKLTELDEETSLTDDSLLLTSDIDGIALKVKRSNLGLVSNADFLAELENYLTADEINTLLTSYVTDDELVTALSSYVTDSELTTVLSNYYTKSEIDTFFAGLTVPTLQQVTDMGAETTNKITVPAIQFDINATPEPNAEGLLQWNATDGTLDLGMDGGDITMQLGQEMFTKVRNQSGATILNGKAVYFSGRLGNRPLISLALGDADSTSRVAGITTEDITSPSDGFITTVGYVRGIKTDYTGAGDWGTTWVEGDILYVSKTVAGQITNVEPAIPHHSDIIGSVGIIHSSLGSILINIERHKALEGLSDVNGTVPIEGSIPSYHASGEYFDFDKNIDDYVPYLGALANVNLGNFGLTASTLNVSGLSNLFTTNYTYRSAPVAPTTALAGIAGLVPVRTNYYRIAYTTAEGTTQLGASSTIVVSSSANAQVDIGLPIGPAGTLTRRIYRGAGNSILGFIAEVADNTTTTYRDNIGTDEANDQFITPNIGNRTSNNMYANGTKILSIDNGGSMRFNGLYGNVLIPAGNLTPMPICLFNTVDERNNVEYGGMRWNANIFEVGTSTRGAGLARKVRLRSNAGAVTVAFDLERGGTDWASIIDTGTSNGGVSFVRYNPVTWTASAGENKILTLGNVNISQTGTGGYSLFNIDVTGGTGGSGTKLFSRYTLGATTIHSINYLGVGYFLGGLIVYGDIKTDSQSDTITFLGVGAGNSNTVTGIGSEGLNNSAFGYQALYVNTTGYNNTANGYQALRNNTSGVQNSAFGYQTLASNTTGIQNTAFGTLSLYTNSTGSSNTAVGYATLQSNSSGAGNTGYGRNTLYANTTGNDNNAIGNNALRNNTTGSSNSAFGVSAGYFITGDVASNTTGTNSLFLGNFTKANADGETNQIVIGYDTTGNGSNSVTLGNTNITKTILRGNVGIGTSSPSARLHIISTTEQFRSGYDVSNYWNATTSSIGVTTFNGVGSGASFIFSDDVTLPKLITTSTIELGHATDTTITRVSAGVVSIEGVTIATSSNTLAFTNKTGNISQWTNDSGYITSSALTPYLLSSTASSTYAPLNNPTFTGILTTPALIASGLNYPTGDGALGQLLMTDGLGNLSWTNPALVLYWYNRTTNPPSGSINTGYIADSTSLITILLPSTAPVGSILRVAGKGTGGWKISQNAGEQIIWNSGGVFGTDCTTVGTGGYLASTDQYDAIELICIVADTTWSVVSSKGNITIV